MRLASAGVASHAAASAVAATQLPWRGTGQLGNWAYLQQQQLELFRLQR